MAQDYRGKGLGTLLLKGVQEQRTSFAGALWFNEANYRSYGKSGWLDVPDFRSYVKILNPRIVTERVFKNQTCADVASCLGRTALRIRERMCPNRNRCADIRIGEVEQFDHSIDGFYRGIADSFGIMVTRNAQYLNWRFVEKPFNNYKRYMAFDKAGELSGYMVLKKETLENAVRGRILDILADPGKPDVFGALIVGTVQEFSRVSADCIEITCTYPSFSTC